jgi:hypothetical protein
MAPMVSHVQLRGVASAENRFGVVAEVADLILILVAAAEAYSRSSTSAKMLRLTEHRGSRVAKDATATLGPRFRRDGARYC